MFHSNCLHLYFCRDSLIRNQVFKSRIFLKIQQQSSVIGHGVHSGEGGGLISPKDDLQQHFSPRALSLPAVLGKACCFLRSEYEQSRRTNVGAAEPNLRMYN